MKKFILIFQIILYLLILSCSKYNYPENIKQMLKDSGKNKKEIKKAIIYFQEKGDSLQIDALYFLLENLINHSYTEAALYDSNKVEITFNILDYENYDKVISYLDSLEKEQGELHWKLKEKYEDIKTITSELLIENIELAFESWKNKPWAKQYSYNIFKEYILPYRGSNEPIESWRPYFLEHFKHLPEKLENPADPIEASRYINEETKSLFGFDPRFYCHPTDQGLEEMLSNKIGRCEDITNFIIYAMRANSLPVTSDYTPHWANTGNNHAWNSIITPDGKVIPDEYNLRSKLAKAYRKTFSQKKDNLAFKLEEWEKVPAWLGGKSYIDVTPLYTDVSDVTLSLEKEIPDSTRFVYLCVFNSGEWKAIHWGEIKDSTATFTDMGVDIVYLPMFYVHKELIPAGNAFILEGNGNLRILSSNDSTINPELISVTKKTIEKTTEGKRISFMENNCDYEFFYWDDEWKSLGEKTCTGEPLFFENVPSNHLYWLVEKDSRKEERIFTYENNKQVWW